VQVCQAIRVYDLNAIRHLIARRDKNESHFEGAIDMYFGELCFESQDESMAVSIHDSIKEVS
jgi:hypothetical protein